MAFLSEELNRKINKELARHKDIRSRVYFLLWLLTNSVGAFFILQYAQRLRDQNSPGRSAALPDVWNDWNFMVAALVATLVINLVLVVLLVRLNTPKGEKALRNRVTGAVIAEANEGTLSEKAKRDIQIAEDGELIYVNDYHDDENTSRLYTKGQ